MLSVYKPGKYVSSIFWPRINNIFYKYLIVGRCELQPHSIMRKFTLAALKVILYFLKSHPV